MKNFWSDFKAFIAKGNIIDMAVGVIIGGAFGKIVTSLVDDVIMPLISLATGGLDFTAWKWVIRPDELDAAGEIVKAGVSINYGNFINVILNFLIIALCIFLVLRAIVKAQEKVKALAGKKEEEEAEEEEEKETAEDILAEIRDYLKKDKE